MTTRPQPEPHLDADQLAAFAEGALPASERALCLQHLAECAHCREVAFLAVASVTEDAPTPAPSRRFTFAWWPVLSLGAATLAAVVITVALMHHTHQSAASKPVQMALQSSGVPAPPAAAAPAMNETAVARPRTRSVAKPSPAVKATAKQPPPPPDNQKVTDAALATAAAPIAGASPQPAVNQRALKGASPLPFASAGAATAKGAVAGAPKAAPSSTLRTYSQAYLRSPNGLAGIAGTITDPAGAIIPHAKVTLDQASGTTHRETFTDAAGRFTIPSLQPGRYRLEISSPGFLAQVREVEVGTSQTAQVDSTLPIGAVSETVEVQSAAPALNTESASVQSTLPDRQPLESRVTNGTRTLALDTSGKLFLNKKGKRWKPIHGPWKRSAVTELSLTTDQSFKVTTAQGSWLSPDGEHWRSTK